MAYLLARLTRVLVLVGVTPASGYVANQSAFFIGVVVGVVSKLGGGWMKEVLHLDDVLDVCSLQAIPGVIGSILLAFLAEESAGVHCMQALVVY